MYHIPQATTKAIENTRRPKDAAVINEIGPEGIQTGKDRCFDILRKKIVG